MLFATMNNMEIKQDRKAALKKIKTLSYSQKVDTESFRKKIEEEKFDYSKLLKYYKRKLVDYGAMKEIVGFKSEGKYIKNKDNSDI